MSGGKRVAANPAGQPAAGGVKPGVVIAAIVGVLLAAYVGLCVWVNQNKTIFPNVSVAGIDVSGMTMAEAYDAIEHAVSTKADQAVVKLAYGEWNAEIKASNLADDGYFAKKLAVDAYLEDKKYFLTYGFQFLRHLLGGRSSIDLTMAYDTVAQPALEAVLAEAQEKLGSDTLEASYAVKGDQLVMTKGVTDVSVDLDSTVQALYTKMEQEVFPAIFRGEAADATVELVVGEVSPITPDFNAIYTELYAEVAEPLYDKETGTVSDHVVGIDFNVNALKASYENAAEGETFSIPLTITQPKDTKDSFEKKLFSDVLGTATSKVVLRICTPMEMSLSTAVRTATAMASSKDTPA